MLHPKPLLEVHLIHCQEFSSEDTVSNSELKF